MTMIARIGANLTLRTNYEGPMTLPIKITDLALNKLFEARNADGLDDSWEV